MVIFLVWTENKKKVEEEENKDFKGNMVESKNVWKWDQEAKEFSIFFFFKALLQQKILGSPDQERKKKEVQLMYRMLKEGEVGCEREMWIVGVPWRLGGDEFLQILLSNLS